MSDKLRLILESVGAMGVFKDHCRSSRTEEMCGLFVVHAGDVLFVPCENTAYDRKNSFLVHPRDYVKASELGDVIGVGHSHVINSCKPSPEDAVHSENCKLPFVIYQCEADRVGTYDPTGQVPDLIGRTWVLGVSDCYTLVRDYYKTQGLELNDYVRNEFRVLRDHSMFMEHFEKEGFVEVDGPVQVNDAVLMQIAADIANHVAVVTDDNIILHHLQGRLSCREPYGGYWRRHTLRVLRHKKWL